LQIELLKTFREQAREMPKARRREIARVIDATHAGFGKPHLHSGLSIRRLRQNYFECRVGLDIRLAFRVERNRMIFVAAGNHDDIRRLLKNL
jgi:mRNA-degrading endonuclease YafQ of YafQ-DinJ toxin-antitoxin module